jgi:hypothetical protein
MATPRRLRPKRAPKITLAGIVSAEIATARNTNAVPPTAVIETSVIRAMQLDAQSYSDKSALSELKGRADLSKMRGKVGECQYLNGAVFCCEPTEPGKPYCHTHANVCYARSASQRAAALMAIEARAERAAAAE